jgi:hypothetical protein
MFENSYLELVGLPLGTDQLRQEILNSPIGIDGLVLGTTDPDATYAELSRENFHLRPIQHFSRMVALDGVEHQARFTTIRLVSGEFAAGRVYFCHHETPELVWRDEWVHHPNGATAIARLTIVSDDPHRRRDRYARLGRFDSDFALDLVSQQDLEERFGALACQGDKRPERFAAITLYSNSLALLTRHAASLGLPYHASAHRLVILIPAVNTLLEFIQ